MYECNKNTCESLALILKSIGTEELALARIIEAESEKLEAVLGAHYFGEETDEEIEENCGPKKRPVDVEKLLAVNESIKEMLNTIIKKELILLMKLDSTLDFMRKEMRL
ncbi:MAG: hypothetical protein Q8876_00260 [Bacillota bacterium]|nr:hypothetical protein [Bacillota bacterium]